MLIFKKIRWKNFLITGAEFIEIELDRSPTTLILGSNGSGKSTVLDALHYALFDRPFRKLANKKTALVNSFNNKECLVELEISVDGHDYLIRRGQKPNIFEIYIDGKLPRSQEGKSEDQQEFLINEVIKFNAKTFSQVVVLGSATFAPFMQLTATERRQIIEDLLDIEVFTRMHKIVKADLVVIQNDINLKTVSKNSLNDQIVKFKRLITEFNDKIKSSEQELKQDINRELARIDDEIQKLQDVTSELNKELTEKTSDKTKFSPSVNRLNVLNGYVIKINSVITTTDEQLSTIDEESCFQCKQMLPQEQRLKVKNDLLAKKLGLQEGLVKAEAELLGVKQDYDKYNSVLDEISVLSNNLRENNNKLVALRYDRDVIIKRTSVDLEGLKQSMNSLKLELDNTNQELDACTKSLEDLHDRRRYIEIGSMLLQDGGVKTTVIKQFLPIINHAANRYIATLELFASLELDESFNDTIKLRHLDIINYHGLSMGQQRRIDLAILFAWREVARTKARVRTNLLLMDEIIDSSLDELGIDNFFKIIEEVSADTNVFIISPRGQSFADKFEQVLTFEYDGNYNGMRKLT